MFTLLCMLVTCFGFHKDLYVYAIAFMYHVLCTYHMHVYLYAYVTMYVCMCIIIIVYCFHYSEWLESPITQEINCTALSSTSVKIQKMSKNSMPNVTWNRKKYALLGNAGITSS